MILIVNIIVLFAAQLIVSLLWYSFLFKGTFTEIAKSAPETTKVFLGTLYKYELLTNLVKAVFVALIVSLATPSFSSFFILLLFVLAIPAMLVGSSVRVGGSPYLAFIDSVQLIVSFVLMFVLAFIIRASMS